MTSAPIDRLDGRSVCHDFLQGVLVFPNSFYLLLVTRDQIVFFFHEYYQILKMFITILLAWKLSERGQ